MHDAESTLEWAKQYLVTEKESTILDVHEIVNTSYSIVHRIKTTVSTYYLKQAPEKLFLEAEMLIYLNQQGCKHIPEVIEKNDKLFCFLMGECGHASLRELFSGSINIQQLSQGISNYTTVQRSLETHLPNLLSLGVPDWRLEQFPSLYAQLVEQEELLQKDGLDTKELDNLQQLKAICVDLCSQLASFEIPETLNHCDFHENNMLLDNSTGGINIIDWGETVIAHPFFSLCGCIWNLTYFQQLKKTDSMYLQLEFCCISAWRDLHSEQKLLQALSVANQLSGIFAALGYERMYSSTEGQARSVQQEHQGSIAGCLRTFMSCMQ